jgi:hypothetical protein
MAETRIKITVGGVTVFVVLNESGTAGAVAGALPLESSAKLWGDEVYFEVPVQAEEENPQEEVPPGGVAFWPPGKALCLFFGQKPYSAVNIVGKMEGDPQVLASVVEGDAVTVERA